MSHETFNPNDKLLALSWKQPYADLMVAGKIETRRWATNYRGWVLICTSKIPYKLNHIENISGRIGLLSILTQLESLKIMQPKFVQCLNGKAIAIGRLVDCRRMAHEDEDKCFVEFYPELFCHVYEYVRPIVPFDWNGSQGFKEVSQYFKDKIVFI